MKSIFLTGLALLLSLTSTTLAQENQEQSIAQFVSEIDEKMPQLLQDFSVPGAAIAIIENGEIVLQKGYGFSDIENEVKVDTKTGFNIGSISKTIAAWGVMKLIEIAKEKNFSRIVSVQNPYNLLNRSYEVGLAEVSIREQCGLLAYSPLAGGRLRGKYMHGEKPKNSRFALWPGRFSKPHAERGELEIVKYADLAKKYKIREDEISRLLGVTQAAVSNYIRGIRGDPKLIEKLLEEKQVASMITEITDNLASDDAYTPLSLSKFIGLCNYIKSSLLICDIHHNLESDIDEVVCKECENMLLKGPGSVY